MSPQAAVAARARCRLNPATQKFQRLRSAIKGNFQISEQSQTTIVTFEFFDEEKQSKKDEEKGKEYDKMVTRAARGKRKGEAINEGRAAVGGTEPVNQLSISGSRLLFHRSRYPIVSRSTVDSCICRYAFFVFPYRSLPVSFGCVQVFGSSLLRHSFFFPGSARSYQVLRSRRFRIQQYKEKCFSYILLSILDSLVSYSWSTDRWLKATSTTRVFSF